jgi:hypothetical protein
MAVMKIISQFEKKLLVQWIKNNLLGIILNEPLNCHWINIWGSGFSVYGIWLCPQYTHLQKWPYFEFHNLKNLEPTQNRSDSAYEASASVSKNLVLWLICFLVCSLWKHFLLHELPSGSCHCRLPNLFCVGYFQGIVWKWNLSVWFVSCVHGHTVMHKSAIQCHWNLKCFSKRYVHCPSVITTSPSRIKFTACTCCQHEVHCSYIWNNMLHRLHYFIITCSYTTWSDESGIRWNIYHHRVIFNITLNDPSSDLTSKVSGPVTFPGGNWGTQSCSVL